MLPTGWDKKWFGPGAGGWKMTLDPTPTRRIANLSGRVLLTQPAIEGHRGLPRYPDHKVFTAAPIGGTLLPAARLFRLSSQRASKRVPSTRVPSLLYKTRSGP